MIKSHGHFPVFKQRFCDRFSENRGYVFQKKFDQVCGEHFNKSGRSQLDMLLIILEEVTPKNDDSKIMIS